MIETSALSLESSHLARLVLTILIARDESRKNIK